MDFEKEDKELVSAYIQGDISAFKTLFERYYRRVFGIIYGLLGNKEDTKDACQDVFIKLASSMGQFKGTSSFSSWLFKIAVNKAYDYLRKAKKFEAKTTHDERLFQTLSTGKRDLPSRLVFNSETARMIYCSLEKLNKDQKTAFLLRVCQGFTYKEIAAVQRCSVGTAMSRTHSAREKVSRSIRRKYA